jgi:CRP-like cAMP-binding protein
MNFNEVRRKLETCQDLEGLDDAGKAFLLWRGQEQALRPNEKVYSEGTDLDDTFCLLLAGTILVEKDGQSVGEIAEGQIFGEMAYFSPHHQRSATIRAGTDEGAVVLKIQLTLIELGNPRFAALKHFLGLEAWDRFVSNSKRAVS